MLHVENLKSTRNPVTAARFSHKKPVAKKSSPASTRLIEMTFGAVELDGTNLWREPEDVALGQLTEAVRLADLRDKTELIINNIAPWIEVGSKESCQVPILQRKIQAHLAEACKKQRRRVPECRLYLARGGYSIRCYLGRNKPTDHVYDEDFVSDSR